MPALRIAAGLLLLVLAAGCGARDAALPAHCPAWSPGLSTSEVHHAFHEAAPATQEDRLGANLLRDAGRPLERIALAFAQKDGVHAVRVQDGRLEVRFHRADTGAALTVYDRALGPMGPANPGAASWTFQDGLRSGLTLHVDLVEADGTPAPPSVVVAQWRFHGNVDGDPSTESGATVAYTATYHYRVC